MQKRIPCVLMRGGTSKCLFFHERDLPDDPELRDRILLSAMGSPDPRQIDGLGGATSTTSKVCIIAPSKVEGAHVDYTFAQVSVTAPLVDYKGNCGNCSSAVGLFAVEE
ncbi:MAG: PrpF domain-containing protein, partial [Dehalococcoidia bacterium]